MLALAFHGNHRGRPQVVAQHADILDYIQHAFEGRPER
jgi:hypothetical protein